MRGSCSLESKNHVLLPDEPAWEVFHAELGDFLGQDGRSGRALSVTRA